jgi:hypothetical protein
MEPLAAQLDDGDREARSVKEAEEDGEAAADCCIVEDVCVTLSTPRLHVSVPVVFCCSCKPVVLRIAVDAAICSEQGCAAALS